MVPAGLGFGTHQSKLLFEVALPNREVAGGVVKNDAIPHFSNDPACCYYYLS